MMKIIEHFINFQELNLINKEFNETEKHKF